MFAWQATDRERNQALPGDELLPEVGSSSSHAITIRAPQETVWPWLVQMGCDRAGWYSYDRLDNGGKPSATTIRPELQQIYVGEILPSRPGSTEGFEVLRFEAPRLLLLGAYFRLPELQGLPWDSARPKAFMRSTWGFYLRETEPGTRLIARVRTLFQPTWVGRLVNAIMGPAHVVMQRKQLLNVRARVEGM